MVVTKMSPTAVKTAWVVVFVMSQVAMYGYGYKAGKHAQLSMAAVMDIVKAQYVCKMEMK